jgi:hypothetical protein
MGAGKRRALRVSVLGVLAVLAGGCSHAATTVPPAAGQTPAPIAPTMTPSPVPALGPLRLGVFPSTWGGANALQVCEDWGWLRGQYAARVQAGDTAFQLEQWFSGGAWQPAFTASSPLLANPGYNGISTAFGMATIGQLASIARAKQLDAACARAD